MQETRPDPILLILFIFLLCMPVNAYPAEPVYTVQTGSFHNADTAIKHYHGITQRLDTNELEYLRVEKVGKFYSVRIGSFEEYPDAEKFLDRINLQLSEAMILKAYIKDDRIVKRYQDSSSADQRVKEENAISALIPEKNTLQSNEIHKEDINRKPSDEFDYALGIVYGTTGRHQEAINAFKRALRANPSHGDAYYNLGILYSKLGMYKEAVEAYKATARIKPDDHKPYVNLGFIYGKLNMHNEAIDACMKAIKINPDDAKAYYNLGLTYSQIERYAEAIEAAAHAIQLNPDDADSYQILGWAYLGNSNREMALEQYEKLKKIDPDKAESLYDLIYPAEK